MAVGDVTIPKIIYPIMGVEIGVAQVGVRYANRDDLTIFKLSEHSHVAMVTTQNAFCAAPVQLARQHHREASPRFLLINTGNANAATGVEGLTRALATCQGVVDVVNDAAIIHTPKQVLPFSTGVIGETLPSERIIAGLDKALAALSVDNWLSAASAIMTTDTTPKIASEQVRLPALQMVDYDVNTEEPTYQERTDTVTYHATGISKGAGMIRPNMATMLGFVATDAPIESQLLNRMLKQLTEKSFNRITIDGDTSTNDCCVLIATGTAPNIDMITDEIHPHYKAVYEMLERIFVRLATLIVRDGEGASKFITVQVTGGKTTEECAKVAYSVAHSPLVKTAFFASDPNWGRILAAVGNAGVCLEQAKVNVSLDEVQICARGGLAPNYTEALGQMVMSRPEITVNIDLGQGEASDTVYTCDLSYDYVKINADYRS